MNRAWSLACSVLVAVVLAAYPAQAAAASVARVAPSQGILAVRAAGQPAWEVIAAGEELPAKCELRSAAFEACRVALPGATLGIGPETRLQLDQNGRAVELSEGGLLVETAEEQAWTVRAGRLSIRFDVPATAEIRLESDRAPVVQVVRGKVTVALGEGEPATVAAGKSASPGDGNLLIADIDGEAQRRVEAWSAAAKPAQGLGQLVIRDPQSDSPVRLNVARYHVHVVLQPPVALVQIDQSFYNPYNRQEEGTFVFNLPPGASVSRFAMYVTHDELIEGELIDRQRASDIYETIVRRKRDPAILEQIGDHLFKMRVFPIFARDTKRILLDFTLPLESDDGRYRFQLPLLSDLEPVADFRLSGVLHGPTLLESVQSPTFPGLEVERRDDGALTFDLQRTMYRPETDFALRFTQRLEQAVALRAYHAEPLPPRRDQAGRIVEETLSRGNETYFLATLRSEEAKAPEPPPADLVVLVDTSSGMLNCPAARRAARTLLGNLRPGDRFRLAALDAALRELTAGWLPATDKNVEAALDRLDGQFCLGGTDLAGGFQQALDLLDKDSKNRRLVVYIGDGEDTLNRRGAEPLETAVAEAMRKSEARLIAVLARPSPAGQTALESWARATGGLFFDLAGDVNGPQDLFAWTLAGVPSPERILAVQVDGAQPEDLYYPPTWLPGKALTIYGRTEAREAVHLTVVVQREGKPQALRWELPIPEPADDVFIGRLWAQKRLDALQREPETGARQEGIVALSQEWSLLAPQTAFLVLESEADYRRWNVDRRQRRRYWTPADRLPEAPLPADWLRRVAPEPAKATEAARVARTIDSARQALANGDDALAFRLLGRISGSVPETLREEYDKLRERALAGLQAMGFWKQLGPHQGLFDPAVWTIKLETPGVAPLLSTSISASAEFFRRHPYARSLLEPITIQPRNGREDGFNIDELVMILDGLPGVNVVVDRQALAEMGLAPDFTLDLWGRGQIPLRDYVRFVLGQVDLVMVEEPHRLWITTPEMVEMHLAVEVYPVADLLVTDRVAGLELLVDPYLDHEEAVRRRIEEKLEKPLSVSFQETPLSEVVDFLATALGEAVLIDLRALEVMGLSPEIPVTASWNQVPAREGLVWILDQLDLDYMLQNGALMISTPEEVECSLEVRLHSGRGLLNERPLTPEEVAARRAWEGFGMGMAGAAPGMGGVGGGFFGGGGMGGMGMGGMGGGFGTPPAGPIGLSETGAPATAEAEPAPQVSSFPSGAEPAEAQPQSAEPEVEYDIDSVADIVTSTIEPVAWDEVGGPGSLGFFPPTLDFVVAQTHHVHEQIEALFDRLRKLPPVPVAGYDWRPAQVHTIAPEWGLGSLLDLITTTIEPTSWSNVGGAGSIQYDLPRLALIVSQTPEIHDQLWRLLVKLRRSRWESLRKTRPWDAVDLAQEGPPVGGWGVTGLSAELRLDGLPEPKPEELQRLAARRPLPAGTYAWRLAAAQFEGLEITLRVGDGRLELDTPETILRAEGQEAAFGYPSLALVELGNWGEAVRQTIDTFLPWLPHRSNRELARWFEVQAAPDKPANEATQWLRLSPHNASESVGLWIDVAVSRSSGRITQWESYCHGKLSGRIRFLHQAEGAEGVAKTIVLEDVSGNELARWELQDSQAAESPVPELTAGWSGFVVLDRRSKQPAANAEFRQAVEAIRKHEISQASKHLDNALWSYPDHPLLLLLKAWCWHQDPRTDAREAMLAALRKVAASRAIGLTRFIANEHFPELAPEELYDILQAQPEPLRRPADWDHLARAAEAAGRLEEALRHTEAAIAAAGSSRRQFERHKMRVDLLLRLQRADDAAKAAETWAAQSEPTVEELTEMAGLLDRHGAKSPALAMLDRALARKNLSPEQRHDLLLRKASLSEGLARWRLLAQAAEIEPDDLLPPKRTVGMLLNELRLPHHAEIAAILAAEARKPHLQIALRLRQAELTADPEAAGDLVWDVYQKGRLPEDYLGRACLFWNRARQYERTIEAVEAGLRSGKAITEGISSELAIAYRQTGRPLDARRAATSDRWPEEPPSWPTPWPGDPRDTSPDDPSAASQGGRTGFF